jgi:hypothetical protein
LPRPRPRTAWARGMMRPTGPVPVCSPCVSARFAFPHSASPGRSAKGERHHVHRSSPGSPMIQI